MAATMRSLTSPVIAPLYWPTQARSDWSARRSACGIALAVSAGVCSAGRIGTVVTGFGLAPAVDGGVSWAWAEAPIAANINVAVSNDLMTGPGPLKLSAIKHICLVGNSCAMVQGRGMDSGDREGRSLTMLSAEELERYARHIVLRDVGGPGQAALKAARVLVIGAGGLGAPVLLYLAAAGVGTLGIVDDDIVSLSNLQRQVIHTTPDIGRQKVDSAAEQI